MAQYIISILCYIFFSPIPKTACVALLPGESKKKKKRFPGPILELLNKNLQGLRISYFYYPRITVMQLSVGITAI